jgi:uncharacterized protein YjdB
MRTKLILAFLACAACSGDVTGTSAITSHLRISANVSNTPIATVVVTVSAPDIHDPLVFNVSTANGVASATIDVPPGHARLVTAQGFDATGAITHEGSTTIDVVRGSNPPIALTMRPKAGQVSVTVNVGSIGLITTPASVTIADQYQNMTTLAALATDETGATIAGAQIRWASSNPAVATVDENGVVLGHVPGSAQIVATYGGIAAPTNLTVISWAGTSGANRDR